MARVFSLDFPYKGETYTAVICQVDGSLTVYIPDETLHSLLPEGRFSFNPQQGIKTDTPHQDLVVSILNAVETQHSEVIQNLLK